VEVVRKSFPFGNVFGFGPRMTCTGEVHIAVSISLHKVVAEIISIMSFGASNTLAASSSVTLGEFWGIVVNRRDRNG
jgi:hypothetical protein